MSKSPFFDDAEMFSPPPASSLFFVPVTFLPIMILDSLQNNFLWDLSRCQVGVPVLETEVASAAKRMRAAAVRASEAVQVRSLFVMSLATC